jgi:hypothetical protein
MEPWHGLTLLLPRFTLALNRWLLQSLATAACDLAHHHHHHVTQSSHSINVIWHESSLLLLRRLWRHGWRW